MSNTGTIDHGPPDDRDKVAILSRKLVEAFGADACRVVDCQIDADHDEQARAIWIAVWEHLCSREARRA
jgi:hypothetical protein